MGLISELFQSLLSFGRKGVGNAKLVGLGIKTANGGVGHAAKGTAQKLSPAKVVAIGTAAWGILSTIGYLLLFLITVWILPILIASLSKSSLGIQYAIQKWESSVDAKIKNKHIKGMFRIVVRIIPEFLLQYANLLVFVAMNIVLLLALCAFVFVFVYFVERHLNESIEFISNAGDLVIEGLNFGGSFVEILYEVRMYLMPITNMIIRFNMTVMIHIYDGMVLTIESMDEVSDIFTGRRRLSQLQAESFFEALTPIIQLGQMVYNVYLAITTTVIDIFFAARIVNIVMLLADILMILVSKVLCYIAGVSQACCFREMIDFLVFNIIIDGFLNPIIGIFGASIPLTHDIACPEAVLVAIGINAQCGGGILSLEPYPGIYINAPKTRRRLISCHESSEGYHEYVDDLMTHSTTNQSDACPHARTSFYEHGNALNMQVLDTHDCYDVCVQNVLYESCPNGVQTFKGKCGTWNQNISLHEGRRRLDTFFQMPTGLQARFNDVIPPGTTYSRTEMVSRLRDRVNAVIFSTEHGHCDLSRPPTNIYEILYDSVCVVSKLYTANPGHSRNLQDIGPINPISEQAQSSIPSVQAFRHSMRKYSTHSVDEIKHPSTTSHLDSAIFALKRHLHYMKTGNCQARGLIQCPHKTKCVNHLDECQARPITRRRLDTVCEDNKQLCPNAFQCVDDLDTCIYDGPLSFLGRIRSYFYAGIKILREFNIGDAFYDMYVCWKGYQKDTQTDPYSMANIYAPMEDLETRAHWCIPMHRPGKWQFTPWTYSVRDAIRESCVSASSEFKSCTCPMYYPLPSTSLMFLDFVSSDLGFILMNGVIFFKNIFAAVTHNVFGYMWSSFCAQPTCSREVSHALSLYSTEIPTEVYVACGGLHLGSASALVLVLVFVIKHIVLAHSMVLFISSGGKTRYERNIENIGAVLEINQMKRDIATHQKKLY